MTGVFFYVNSADNILFTPSEYGPLIVTVSEPLFNFKYSAEVDSIIRSGGLGLHEKVCKEIEDNYLKETGLIFQHRCTYCVYHIPGKKSVVTNNLEERVTRQQGYTEDEYRILDMSDDISYIYS